MVLDRVVRKTKLALSFNYVQVVSFDSIMEYFYWKRLIATNLRFSMHVELCPWQTHIYVGRLFFYNCPFYLSLSISITNVIQYNI